jgi:DNA-binding FadR family transcriptional regulator
VASPLRAQRHAAQPSYSGRSGSKLAAQLASRIVHEVVTEQLPIGTVVGSEPELIERYGVSRAVFREAVRLVEHQGVAEMRRGPGGGLVVAESDVNAVLDAAVIYFLRVHATLDEVFEARLILEELATDLASQRVSEDDLLHLREHIDEERSGAIVDPRAFHALLARMSRNPALEVFVDLLNRLVRFYFSDTRVLKEPTLGVAHTAHGRIAEAVLDGDGRLARQRMAKHLNAEVEFIRQRKAARQLLKPAAALHGAPGSKRAETVARQIFARILEDGLAPGDFIGSEPDLVAESGVSRSVFREAVRILEHQNVAMMRRGTNGGLLVAEPSIVGVSEVLAVYLARQGISEEDLGEVRRGVESTVVSIAMDADRLAETTRRVTSSLEMEEASDDMSLPDRLINFHATLASCADNRVLELITLILARLSLMNQSSDPPQETQHRIKTEVLLAHRGIGDAIVAGDRQLALHRLRGHLEEDARRLA